MDFRRLAQFVLVAGLAVLGCGGFKYLQAGSEAKRQTAAAAKQTGYFGAVFGGLDAAMKQEAA